MTKAGRYNKKATTKTLLDWRRAKVQEYWCMGWDRKRIADKLQVSERQVYEDQCHIEKSADKIMHDYLSNTVPHIVNRSLQRLELINAQAWKVVEECKTQREKISAMQVIGKSAIDSVTIVAGIRELIDFALDNDKYVSAVAVSSATDGSSNNNLLSDQQTESEIETDSSNNDSDNSTDNTEGETAETEQDNSQAKF